VENAPLMSRLLKLTVGRVVVRFGVGVGTGLGLEEPPQPAKTQAQDQGGPEKVQSCSGLHGLLRVKKRASSAWVGMRDRGAATSAPPKLRSWPAGNQNQAGLQVVTYFRRTKPTEV
jgi:hypothetical protein